jgi:glutathione S-transferase
MLAAGDVAFESVALSLPDDFDQLKADGKLPFNQLPLLEIDGLRISQSLAMVQYVGRRCGFYGEGSFSASELARLDMIQGAVKDLASPAMGRPFNPDQAVAIQSMVTALAKFGPRLEAMLSPATGLYEDLGRESGKLTIADILTAEALHSYLEVQQASPDLFTTDIGSEYPSLTRLYSAVTAHPPLRAYLDGEQHWPMPDADYVSNVRCVLSR